MIERRTCTPTCVTARAAAVETITPPARPLHFLSRTSRFVRASRALGGQCESGNCLNAVLPRRANSQVFDSTAKWQPQARHVGESHLNALRAIGRRYGHVRAITDVRPKFGTEAAYV